LSRGEYHDLVKAGLNTPEAIEIAKEDEILACVREDLEKARTVRAAVAAIRAEPQPAVVATLPKYEA
jgi:hypothetical protein